MIRINQVELRRADPNPKHEKVMHEVGEHQTDAEDPNGMSNTFGERHTQQQEEQADVAVMNAQAERHGADHRGVARRFEGEAETQHNREYLEDESEDRRAVGGEVKRDA